jgi:hypothetical protein
MTKSLWRAFWPVTRNTASAQEGKRFQYRVPTYLIAFPRSGSNFLQQVIESSSGLTCRSLYAVPHDAPHKVLNFKSHALSYAHLLDEVTRLVGPVDAPEKIIVLQRDPRDVMISFYEFVQTRKEIAVPQEDFFHHICFFWTAFVDKDRILERRVELAPLSIAEAYRRHVQKWFVQPDFEGNVLRVRYERLVEAPEVEFDRIFRYLELDCELARDSLDVMVSQYSKTSWQRGRPSRWRQYMDRYPALLSAVNDYASEEIRLLGYDD